MASSYREEIVKLPNEQPAEFKLSRSRIMYVEAKSGENDIGLEARIGRVYFSKSGRSLYYRGMVLRSLKGKGFKANYYKANYYDVESGAHYWISGPHKDQNDRLYGGSRGVIVDSDVEDEYRRMITPSV